MRLDTYNVGVIDVTCTCGRSFRVPDDKAGARGKCQVCGKVVVVPAAPATLPIEFPPAPAPVILTLEPRDASVPMSAPPKPPGEHPVRQDRVLKTRKEEDSGPSGFLALLVRMYLRPVSTMASLTFYLSSVPMLTKMAIFWVLSLAVVFVNAGAGIGQQAKPAQPPPEVATPKPKTGPASWTGPNGKIVQKGGGLRATLSLEPDPPLAGVDVQLVCQVVDEQMGKPFDGEVVITSFTRTVHTPGGAPAVAQPQPFGPGTQGNYVSAWECDQHGEYALAIAIRRPGAEPLLSPTFVFHACDGDDLQAATLAAVEQPEAPTGGEESSGGGGFSILHGLLAVVGSVFGLFITAATVNLAGRVIGSGGSFLALLAVLAFLSGIVNDAQVVMLLGVRSMGSDVALVAKLVFWVWQTALFFLALMKVYDVDFMFALGILLLSNVMQYFGAFWILVAITKMFA